MRSLSDVRRWWIRFIRVGAAQGWSYGPHPIIVSIYSVSGVRRFDDSNDGKDDIVKFGLSQTTTVNHLLNPEQM
jgi:hypothetical protein